MKKIVVTFLSGLLLFSHVSMPAFASDSPDASEAASETIVFEAPSDDIKPNSSSMVDYIASEAKKASNESISDEKRDAAIKYIFDHYSDYYENNTVMENTMYYGYYLEYAYAKNGSENLYANLGIDTYQAIKYVYRNAEKPDSEATLSNLEQIAETLYDIGYDVDEKTPSQD